MTQFSITRSPGGMEIMFALFDPAHPRTVKFMVQGTMYGKKSCESMVSGEDKIRREVFDEDIPPHEIEVKVTGLAQASGRAIWILDGKTVEEKPQSIRCYFSSVKREGHAYIGKEAEDDRLWQAQHPEVW
jgi:hypothetical protein